MYRSFVSPYYGYHRRYCPRPCYRSYNNYWRYYYPPYNNYINSQIADIDQGLYNFGYMKDVYQNANVMQSSASFVGIATTEIPVIPYEFEHSEQTGICTNMTTFQFTNSNI